MHNAGWFSVYVTEIKCNTCILAWAGGQTKGMPSDRDTEHIFQRSQIKYDVLTCFRKMILSLQGA